MRRKKMISLVCMILSASIVLSGCERTFEKKEETPSIVEEVKTGDYVEKAVVQESVPLMDNKALYENDEDTSVVTMYLTVRQGNEEDVTNHTWGEINTYDVFYYEENELDRYKVEGILQVGDENGPVAGEFGYGETVPNVTVQIRGQTSSRADQKNYKIRIKDGKGTWRDQQTLALNKHAFDPVRFRNKLAYDLIKTVPQMLGARTQFVHLYVKDETGIGAGEYVDYGLYTQVEQINRTYLKSHGLDNKGHLYKANFFEWYVYDEIMKLKTDSDYDEVAFQQFLEAKGNQDHSKIQSLITKINDYTIPIKDIVEQHFDVDNICYWMAFQILIGNNDVSSRNYYLYSPLNSEKWYIISWDNDGSFIRSYYGVQGREDGTSWDKGLTLFVGSQLYKRMFTESEYRNRLISAVEDLKNNYLTEAIVDAKIKSYVEVVRPYISSYPDNVDFDSDTEVTMFEYLVTNMAKEIELNYQYFQQSLMEPWPFYVALPEEKNGKTEITWDVSYDPNNEEVTYYFAIARDYQFTDVLYEEKGLRIPMVTIEKLEPGMYFIRVCSENESGYEQDCFDYITVDGKGKQYATMAVVIHEDGSASAYMEDVREEDGGDE